MEQKPIFRLEREENCFRLLYDGGSCTWDDPKTVRQFFNMWMKEHKL